MRTLNIKPLVWGIACSVIGILTFVSSAAAQHDDIPPLTQTLSAEDELGTITVSLPEDWAASTNYERFEFASRESLLDQSFPYDFDSGDFSGGVFAIETQDKRRDVPSLLADIYEVATHMLPEGATDLEFGQVDYLTINGRDILTNLGANQDYDHVFVMAALGDGNVGVMSVFMPQGEGEAYLPTLTAVAMSIIYPDEALVQPPQNDSTPDNNDDREEGIVAEPGSEPASIPDTDVDLSSFTEILVSNDGKLTVYYPDDWVTNAEEDYVELANHRRTLNAEFPYDLNDSDEFIVGIVGYESPRRNEDRVLESLLDDYQDQRTNDDLDVTWSETETLDLSGRKALRVIGTADEADQIVIVVSLGDDLYATVIMFTAPENTDAFIGAVTALASIVQYDPEGVPDYQRDGRDA